MKGYKSEGTNIACEDKVEEYEIKGFGADFKAIPVVAESYYPTRLEYLQAKRYREWSLAGQKRI